VNDLDALLADPATRRWFGEQKQLFAGRRQRDIVKMLRLVSSGLPEPADEALSRLFAAATDVPYIPPPPARPVDPEEALAQAWLAWSV
jgi:hypothetical protein